MPTYDYACVGCGHKFEKFESLGDGSNKECPRCRRKKARRMLGTGAGIIFKGSGFYTTDYKRASVTSSKAEPSGTGKTKGASCELKEKGSKE